MTRRSRLPTRLRRATAAFTVLLVAGCGSLLPAQAPPALTYTLDGGPRPRTAAARPALGGAEVSTSTSSTVTTVIVSPPRAAPGYDSPKMVYVRVTHQLEHFARSEWADTPARMLAPIIVAALDNTPGLRAVGPASSGAGGDWRLDTEVLHLQHEFGGGPSRVRLALRATLVDTTTRQVISSQVFEETVASATEDAYGGVVAANRAVQRVVEALSRQCALAVLVRRMR